MPWQGSTSAKERLKFIKAWEKEKTKHGKANVAELCREFGISRPTAYVWINRYEEGGGDLTALEERSRRPHTNPRQVGTQMQKAIVSARKKNPELGPRKIREMLVGKYSEGDVPSASTIGNILAREGLVEGRAEAAAPRARAAAPRAAAPARAKAAAARGATRAAGRTTTRTAAKKTAGARRR